MGRTTVWGQLMNNATPLRLVDWKPRLVDYLSRSASTPFAYGQFDCFLFTLGAVAVMTDIDLTLDYRGRYSTLRQGIALARKRGLRDHIDLVARHFDNIPPSFARAGDIAVVAGADGPALGLVQGEHIFALVPSGMAVVPLTSALHAFRVA